MDFNPPLNERKTKELLTIISNSDQWSEEMQQLAEEELHRRKYTDEMIAREKSRREGVIHQLKNRQVKRIATNKTESYTVVEMLSIIIFFPFSFILHLNPLAEFWKLDAGHYKRKIIQRILLILVSVLLWIQLIKLML